MKHTKEEILNALHVIKDICDDETIDCYNCPFSDSDGHCILTEQIPTAWDIKDYEPWRAFE